MKAKKIHFAEKECKLPIEEPLGKFLVGLVITLPILGILIVVSVAIYNFEHPLSEMGLIKTIDCQWGDWRESSPCSQSCGNAQKVLERGFKPAAQNGGKPCIGNPTKVEDCILQPCPQNCIWAEWSSTGAVCSKTCEGGVKTVRRLLLQPAQFGGTCEGSQTKDEKCNITPCPVHCHWGQWSEWSSCPSNCNKNKRFRTRQIDSEGQSGGERCKNEDRREIENCPLKESCQLTADSISLFTKDKFNCGGYDVKITLRQGYNSHCDTKTKESISSGSEELWNTNEQLGTCTNFKLDPEKPLEITVTTESSDDFCPLGVNVKFTFQENDGQKHDVFYCAKMSGEAIDEDDEVVYYRAEKQKSFISSSNECVGIRK